MWVRRSFIQEWIFQYVSLPPQWLVHVEIEFSVPQIEYPLGGSTKKGSHVYFLLIVVMVLLLLRQIVLLWRQDNIYIKQ